jgi:hypothetical protein
LCAVSPFLGRPEFFGTLLITLVDAPIEYEAKFRETEFRDMLAAVTLGEGVT